ncbi:MAG TPA: hypothetical protein VHI72_16820, partial [Hyphomicrobiaceae bacterium]|nr:hypothetical protein [Hyphomicrobiaceae bacterium]
RGPTVGKKARSRLWRLARMVMAGTSVLEAARQEVRVHGRGGHASDVAAIDYLRHRYGGNAEAIEGFIAAADQLCEQQREFDRQRAAFVDQSRELDRQSAIMANLLRIPILPSLTAFDEVRAQWAELDRQNGALADRLRVPVPPALPELMAPPPIRWWEPPLDGFVRLIGLPAFDGRSTGPKMTEKRSNDMS